VKRTVKLDPLQVIEACYAPEPDESAWARQVLEALSPADRGLGMAGTTLFDETRADTVHLLAAIGWKPDIRPFRRWWSRAPEDLVRALRDFASPVAELTSERFWGREPEAFASFRRCYENVGAADSFAMVAPIGGGGTIQLHVGIPPRGSPPPPRTRHQLSSVVSHLASAARLRRAPGGLRPSPDDPATEAILDARGRVEHLAPEAEGRAARGHLVEAVRRIDRARGRLRWTSPEEALSLWDSLVDGRWSLVDHVDSEGRRYVLARRNPPGRRDARALLPQERAVIALAAQGRSNKYIGSELRLAPSTVAGYLRSSQAKLGVGSRRALIDMLGSGAAANGHAAKSERGDDAPDAFRSTA
jgi:DNA-binding CsgD family transcriptional regulator